MTTRVRTGLMVMLVLATMGLASCGHYTCGVTFGNSTCNAGPPGLNGGGNATGTVFIYQLGQSNSNGTTIVAASLDLSTNKFQEDINFVPPPLPSTFPTDGGTVVVSKGSQKYLYVPFSNGTLYGYAIDGTTGALTAVPNIPYSAAGGTSIASDPAGNFLFVSDSTTNVISVFTIAADGSLTAVANSPFPSQISAAQITTDGKGQFLYAATGPPGGTQIAAFSITSGVGTLTPLLNSPFTPGFSVSKLLGENTGTYLFGINGQTADLYVFTINSGVPTPLASPLVTAAVPADLVVHPSGKFVYTFDGPSAPMEGYQITSGGVLVKVNGSPFTGVDLEKGEFDQSGLFLFGVGLGAGTTFGPYDTDISTGAISLSTFPLVGFLGHGFAVTDLNNAP